MKMLTKTIPIRLIPIPALTICGIVTYPVPNTMALGGVAAGSEKAQDAATVAGIAKTSGERPILTDVAASTGSAIAVEAMLEANSVRVTIARTTTRMNKGSGRTLKN